MQDGFTFGRFLYCSSFIGNTILYFFIFGNARSIHLGTPFHKDDLHNSIICYFHDLEQFFMIFLPDYLLFGECFFLNQCDFGVMAILAGKAKMKRRMFDRPIRIESPKNCREIKQT